MAADAAPIIAGLAGIAASGVTYALGRRSSGATADSTIATAAANIAEAGDAQVRRMTTWLEQATTRMEAAREIAEKSAAEAHALRTEVTALRSHVGEAETRLQMLTAQLDAERTASRQEIARLARRT